MLEAVLVLIVLWGSQLDRTTVVVIGSFASIDACLEDRGEITRAYRVQTGRYVFSSTCRRQAVSDEVENKDRWLPHA